MSGVYIPGLSMPHDENDSIHILRDGTAVVYRTGSIDFYKAIPVPDHGRCIDADAAVANRNDFMNWCYDLCDLPDYLADCPTILPAEES